MFQAKHNCITIHMWIYFLLAASVIRSVAAYNESCKESIIGMYLNGTNGWTPQKLKDSGYLYDKSIQRSKPGLILNNFSDPNPYVVVTYQGAFYPDQD